MRFAIVPLLALASLLAAAGCKKPTVERKPEIMVVGTRRAEPVGRAALLNSAPEYIATVRANEETDFSFKVGGILELIGPEPRRDWDEGSLVKSGAVLARLQQADFKNALASAKANADLAAANSERIRKLLTGNVVSKLMKGCATQTRRFVAQASSRRTWKSTTRTSGCAIRSSAEEKLSTSY